MLNDRSCGTDRVTGIRRVAAFLVDCLLIGLYAGALAAVSVYMLGGGSGGWLDAAFSHPIGAHLLRIATLTGPVLIILAGFEASGRAATPGKRLCGLQVTSLAGGRLSFRRAVGRNALKLLAWELSHVAVQQLAAPPTAADGPTIGTILVLGLGLTLGALYLAVTLIDPGRGPLYDRLLDTRVTKRRLAPTAPYPAAEPARPRR
ncbi:MAG TPA: RDD family protein [Longimicrobiales bacterium]|nr:RDD family protein [Longimicrobiales bacterium]